MIGVKFRAGPDALSGLFLCEKLISYNSIGPGVNVSAMGLTVDLLRREICNGTGKIVFIHRFRPCKHKVAQQGRWGIVALHEDILGFDVAVTEHVVVEKTDSRQNLRKESSATKCGLISSDNGAKGCMAKRSEDNAFVDDVALFF